MTLSTDKQELFDQCARQMAKQGGPARTAMSCVYWDATMNRKCGVGALLPSPALSIIKPDAGTVSNLLCSGLFPEWSENDIPRFLTMLQRSHDSGLTDYSFEIEQRNLGVEIIEHIKVNESKWIKPWSPAGIATRLSYVAKEFNLKTDVLEEVFPK